MPFDVNRNLGPSSSQSATYTAIGHKEDISKFITDCSPDLTLYLNTFGSDADAVALDFSWLTEGMRPPQDNAHLEKEDYTGAGEVGSIEGKKNYCQRFVTSGYVTEAQIKVAKEYRPEDEFVRQLQQGMKRHAQDMEYMLVHSTTMNAGTATIQARSAGVPYFMNIENVGASIATATGLVTAVENYNLETGDFVYFTATKMPAGLAANTLYYIEKVDDKTFYIYNDMKSAVEKAEAKRVKPTDAGTGLVIVKNNVVNLNGAADFSLDDINNAMQMAFNRGGNPTMAFMSPAKKRRFSSLVYAETQVNRGMGRSRKLDIVADGYETDFGSITARPHRMYSDDRIDLMDMQYWDLKWFERTNNVDNLPKKGNYKEFYLQSWLGLKATQPKASAAIINIKR